MVKVLDSQKTTKTLGRHTRLPVPFSWTLGGTLVDLAAGVYTVRVWITAVDGLTTAGPFNAVVSGTVATYQLSAADLPEASGDVGTGLNPKIVAVAENGTNTLVSDAREIPIGTWGGADTYTPTP